MFDISCPLPCEVSPLSKIMVGGACWPNDIMGFYKSTAVQFAALSVIDQSGRQTEILKIQEQTRC
jgi:hypothetical protein